MRQAGDSSEGIGPTEVVDFHNFLVFLVKGQNWPLLLLG